MLKTKGALFLSFILFCLIPAKATQLPVKAYSALPVMSMVRLSPNGDRIAYRAVQNEDDYLIVKNIATGKIIGGFILGDINPSHAYFVDQNRVVLIGSTHKKIMGFRGQHDVSSAFIYDVTTNKVEQLLVPGREIYRGQSGLGRVAGFSEDLQYAYMPAFVGDRGTTPKYNLMKVDLAKPRRISTAERGRHDTRDYFLNAKAEVIARERFNNEKNLHTVEALVDDKWVEIYREETEIMTVSFVGVTPDYKSIVMLGSPDGNQNAYYKMSLTDGSLSDPIFYREDASIERVLKSKQRVVYGVRYSGFRPDYAFFDKRLTQTYKAIQQALPNNTFRIVDHTPDWKTILFYMEGDQSSGDYLSFSGGEFNFLASARPMVNAEAVANVREYSFAARDGLNIPTLLTYPVGKDASKEPLPAILMPHGGPQSHDKISYDWLAQYFANRGFLVIQPQFRGSTGFGFEFTRKGHGEWGKKMQDDLTDSVLHLAEKNLIDKDRVCIVGWSYGGYAALAGATFTPDLYQCVVSINGVSDIERMMKTERRDFGKDHWVVAYWDKIIRDKNLDEDFFEDISPVNFAENVKAPVLLIHGTDDTIAPLRQSEEMADALEDADKKVKFIEIEDEGHSIDKSNNSRLKSLQAIEEFIAKHISK